MSAQPEAAAEPRRWDRDAFLSDLGDVPVQSEPALVKQKSRDFYWYSPILKPQLDRKFADLLVVPRSIDDVIRIAKACVRHKVPVTARGGGTGNYGQAVPLEGGIILDTTRLDRVLWLKDGVVRVECGKKMTESDLETQKQGWEYRMHPSTKRTATVGGFIAGGSGGVGSIGWGVLRDRGNIHGLKLVTFEAEPRFIELRGDDVQWANHAYGVNGIIVELELPMAPARPWIEALVAFGDAATAMNFCQAFAEHDAIVKKECAFVDWPITTYFKPIRQYCPDNQPVAIVMVNRSCMAAFKDLVASFKGEITLERECVETGGTIPLYEYTWNHTTLQGLKVDKSITYLQTLFPAGRNIELMLHMKEKFGDEVMIHGEFVRTGGKVTNSALQMVRYTTKERLYEIIRYHEGMGCRIADPHTYILEDGGKKAADLGQLRLKYETDPHGLLNPGKMRAWIEAQAKGIKRAEDVEKLVA
ncbi:MAG: FAD-binding oxidoreductase [Alphaproteobacteria bacterium]|nr:FAD-binding oxidoreductase [Alphaproteobacteria bacterium]